MKKLFALLALILVVAVVWIGIGNRVLMNQDRDLDAAREAFLKEFPRPATGQTAISNTAPVSFEDPGVIAVEHFTDVCGTSELSGEQEVIALDGSFVLPGFATAATVLLNGWKVRYLESDRNLHSVKASIEDVQLDAGTLTWQAYGVLADRNFDDAYEFCYAYTVIAWNEAELDIRSENFVSGIEANFDEDTALHHLLSYSQNTAQDAQRALLPMGFRFSWADARVRFLGPIPILCFRCNVDRDLLQIAYDLGQKEAYIDADGDYAFGMPDPMLPSDADIVDAGYLTWESLGILKDNDRRHDFYFQEWIQLLGGSDIAAISPPFTVLPIEDIGLFSGCIGGSVEKTVEQEITNIPFEYAVPMLTGWELGSPCDDENVKVLGIQIDEFEYDKPSGAPVGSLKYKLTSVGQDRNEAPGHYSRHMVSILGIKAAAQQPPQATEVDLLVVPGVGDFCNRNDRGDLVVTVENQGDGDAGPTTTSVMFSLTGSNVTSTQATPALAAGTSIDVVFEIPGGCFNADCDFEIAADSANMIIESNEDNNRGTGTCIG